MGRGPIHFMDNLVVYFITAIYIGVMKINMGCGWRNFGKEWIHIDAGNYSHLDHNNIFKLPYEDESVDLIYASHLIEYVDKDYIEPLLLEWKRALKPSAKLRLAVPDFAKIAELYVNGHSLQYFIGPLYGRMKMGGDVIYHKTVYDFDRIKDLLESCGFSNVSRYDWRSTEHASFDDHSQAYLPHMDKENGTLISLNVECNK